MRELSLLEDALANLLSGGNFFEAMDLQIHWGGNGGVNVRNWHERAAGHPRGISAYCGAAEIVRALDHADRSL